MSTPQYIVDANADNFNQLVLENSRSGPVLVNYWSPRAGPCLKLWPTLQNLAGEYAGRFLLVNVNTDTQKQLAKQQGINSVPTVKLFINEQVKAQVHGADSEQSFQKLLDEHLPATTNPAIATAIMAYKQNNHDIAYKLLSDAMKSEPENIAIPLTLIKLYLRENLHEKINDLYMQLPETIKQKEDFISLKTHSHFIQLASQAKEQELLIKELEEKPATPEIIEQLCAISLVNDDYENALKYLLDILKCEPGYNNNIANQGLITIFNLLGQQHPLTKQYRKAMQLILE